MQRKPEIELQEPKYQDDPTVNEPKSVWFNGELLEASRFDEVAFLQVCEQIAGCSRGELVRIGNAYKDLKLICGYREIRKRLTGEEYHQHPKAVALIDMLELSLTDHDQIIAELHHDSPEENAVFYGNTDHPRRSAQAIHISTFDSLRSRYGERSAKMIDAVTKPPLPKPKKTMTPDEIYQYLQGAFLKVITAHFDVVRECARVKTADRVQNLRTEPKSPDQMIGESESFEERLARRVIETHRLILPISQLAGDNYRQLLTAENEALHEVLTPKQKSMLIEDPVIVAACQDAVRSKLVRIFGRLLKPVQGLRTPAAQTVV